ncbi:transmembrane [Cystoisospora suis]|uniref:Transmembrane n=1 Tax=Cystoisospora suis TaxID=483139 RepID=A0A2C6KV76_9APIC|nr:transmembrane [Cystoisospora suis]
MLIYMIFSQIVRLLSLRRLENKAIFKDLAIVWNQMQNDKLNELTFSTPSALGGRGGGGERTSHLQTPRRFPSLTAAFSDPNAAPDHSSGYLRNSLSNPLLPGGGGGGLQQEGDQQRQEGEGGEGGGLSSSSQVLSHSPPRHFSRYLASEVREVREIVEKYFVHCFHTFPGDFFPSFF